MSDSAYVELLAQPHMQAVIKHCQEQLKVVYEGRGHVEIPLDRKLNLDERKAISHYFRTEEGWMHAHYFIKTPKCEPHIWFDKICPKP